MKYVILILQLSLIILTISSKDDKCIALVMSGAGSQGAYQSGVIQGLTNHMPDPVNNLSYDVVAGVSAGSLNALGLAGFKPEEINNASEFLFDFWNTAPDQQIIGNWPDGGFIRGLFYEQGVFTLDPARKWVTGAIDITTVNRKTSFSATDSISGNYTTFKFEPNDTLSDELIETAFASSSIPTIFPPVKIEDYVLIDGGCIWNIDVVTAVRRCKEIVKDEKDIIIDIITVSNTDIEMKRDLSKFSALDHYLRSREINGFYNYMNDFRSAEAMFPDVKFRLLIHPSETLPGGKLPLDFSKEAIGGCLAVGKKDAKNAVKLGFGGYAEVLLEFSDRRKNGEDVNLSDMIDEAVAAKAQKQKVSE